MTQRNHSEGRTALYRLWNLTGSLLYVGTTANPLTRWKEHQRNSPWWTEVAQTTVEWFPSRAEATDAEEAAIAREEPLNNVSGRARAFPRESSVTISVALPADLYATIVKLAAVRACSRASVIRMALRDALPELLAEGA